MKEKCDIKSRNNKYDYKPHLFDYELLEDTIDQYIVELYYTGLRIDEINKERDHLVKEYNEVCEKIREIQKEYTKENSKTNAEIINEFLLTDSNDEFDLISPNLITDSSFTQEQINQSQEEYDILDGIDGLHTGRYI